MDCANLQQALAAARNFSQAPADLKVCEIGAGNINDTFLVTGQGQPSFILQRLSRQAFSSPEQICENLSILNHSLPADRIAALISDRRWTIPQLLSTSHDTLGWCDSNNGFWRALSYINATRTLSCLTSTTEAMEVGRALAIFHNLVKDIEPDSLHVTIPHFHDTPHYFHLYQGVLAANPSCLNSGLAAECLHFIKAHQDSLAILEDGRARGELTVTTIHGDPKLANILFDQQTAQACAFIDLDTVGPGLLLYDLGDCLRSCCNQGGSLYDLSTTRFESDFCRAILQGYLEKGRHLLSPGDRHYLLAAIRLIPLELGIRFFSDYLSGCHYFKTTSPTDTLRRAAAQFRLVANIEEQQASLTAMLNRLLPSP
ncbi:MAG: aminoglycoside phosphotransferase family protein [Proteobacteria bacterium]|nr:aminoglycoside phosphotransferase family protein [Pseudomonadota bacterium]MBU1639152.1 aminoglycoside phosphotransferase family protein [Pseudomonadota bacterium]